MAQTAETSWLREAAGSRVTDFYAAISIELPDRGGEEAAVRCFANPAAHKRDDRNASCSVNLLTGLWKCHGCGLSGNPYSAAVARGLQEPRAAELAEAHGLLLKVAPKPRMPSERQLAKFRARLWDSPLIVARLRELKGWTPEAMRRCGLGWDGERIVFPIRAVKGGALKLTGVVRWVPNGKPKVLAVGKRGLFPAPEITSRSRPLFLVEGECCAVSVWSCGHQAVGVPGAASWRMEWGARLANRRVVILPDADPQGRRLAEEIVGCGVKALVVDLDPAREDGWDVGDMIAEAARENSLAGMTSFLGALA